MSASGGGSCPRPPKRARARRRPGQGRRADSSSDHRERDGRRVPPRRDDGQRRDEAEARVPDVARGGAPRGRGPDEQVGAGAIGMAAIAPPASEPPICPPLGAVPAMPSGRSAGRNAVRWTVTAYPLALLLTTVTRSETGAGVAPDVAFPKLTPGRSSAIERTGWMSMSTAALCRDAARVAAARRRRSSRRWTSCAVSGRQP